MPTSEIKAVLDANTNIDGLRIHSQWDELEPVEGQWNFAALDGAISASRDGKRFYKLLVTPGTHTPVWVYGKGAAKFATQGSNPHRKDTYQKPVFVPVPWDEVYFEYFEKLIQTLGKRYAGDPLCRAVGITGANYQSAEVHLPKNPADREKWDALHYREHLPKAYERFTEIFARAFPRQQLCLHVSNAIRSDDGVIEQVAAYGARRYPELFTLQNCQLSGIADDERLFSYQVIQPYWGKLHIGYQSLALLGGERQGDSQVAVYNYVQGQGEFWELWDGNGRDPKFCRWLKTEIEQCQRLGPSAYRAQMPASKFSK